MKGSRPHFHIVGLQNNAPLLRPERLKPENKALKTELLALIGDHGWNPLRIGVHYVREAPPDRRKLPAELAGIKASDVH